MDYRSAYIRRSRKGVHLNKRLAAIGLLGVAGCATLCALAMRAPTTPAPVAEAQAAVQATTPAPGVLHVAAQAETKQTRRVYPYSIVPGGADLECKSKRLYNFTDRRQRALGFNTEH